MNQNTYSFPKVTPVDPEKLREDLRASRRESPTDRENAPRLRSFFRAPRPSKG